MPHSIAFEKANLQNLSEIFHIRFVLPDDIVDTNDALLISIFGIGHNCGT